MKNNIELCYLYVKEDEKKNWDINLDNEFYFKWNGEYLTIEKKENYINNFNLLIGKNGAGKTTYMNKIIDLTHTLINKTIKVMKIDDTYFIFSFKGFQITESKIKNQPKLKVQIEQYEIDEYDILKDDIEFIHYKKIEDSKNSYHSIFVTNQLSKSNYFSRTVLGGIYQPYNMATSHLLSFPENMFNGIDKRSNVINVYTNFNCYILDMFFKNKYCIDLFRSSGITIPKKLSILNIENYNIKKSLEKLENIFTQKIHEQITFENIKKVDIKNLKKYK